MNSSKNECETLYSYSIIQNGRNTYKIVGEKIQSENQFDNINQYVKRNFENLRIEAEKNAKRLFKEDTPLTLDNIYQVLAAITGLSDEEIELLKNIELFTFGIDFVVDNIVIQYIKNSNKKGNRVVLIEDSYYPNELIKKVLLRNDDLFRNIEIFSAIDYHVTKELGLLYSTIKNLKNITYNNWIHTGNDRIADYLIPKQLGIKACLFQDKSKNTKKEENNRNTIKIDNFKNIILKKYAGANEGAVETGIYAGILLFGYVKWLIDISLNKGIDRLCFIARDGYVLKDIADRIIENLELNIETYYVYSSRKSWNSDSKEKDNRIKGYMAQFLNNTCAFVDLQATGRSFSSMSRICGVHPVYFCYRIVGNGYIENNNWYTYSLDGGAESGIEVLCRALHGGTIDYVNKDNHWIPVLADFEISLDQKNNMLSYFDTINVVANELCKNDYIDDLPVEALCIRRTIIESLFVNPAKCVRDFVGEIIHDNDNDENGIYAPKLSKEQIIKCIDDNTLYKGCSLNYSIMRLDNEDDIKEVKRYLNNKNRIDIVANNNMGNIKIVVYGAGKKGKEIINKLYVSKKYDVVCWIDIDYEEKRKEGLEVDSLEVLKNVEYDLFYISITNNKENIKEYLIECGIPKEKIIVELD